MLIDRRQSRLLVVDLQEKLMPAIHDGENLLNNCRWMVQVANTMDVPVLASEQYPKGLGPTVEPIRSLLRDEAFMEKHYFSCLSDDGCRNTLLDKHYPQTVIIGTEAHVCVMQTALEMKESGQQVFVVEDCIGSRDPNNKHLAIERMRQAGITLVSREMVAFEWLRRAKTHVFRYVNRTFIA